MPVHTDRIPTKASARGSESNAIRVWSAGRRQEPRRAVPGAEDVRWWRELPPRWRALVRPPLDFRVFREYEVAAHRVVGYDADGLPCYCAARYRLTQLRSDDDELFYEETVHAETLTAWRLRDERWLIHRTVYGNDGQGTTHSFFAFSDTMPR